MAVHVRYTDVDEDRFLALSQSVAHRVLHERLKSHVRDERIRELRTGVDADAQPIMKAGGRPFEPVAGHAMTGYVVVTDNWQKKPDAVRAHITRALTLTRAMPAKAKKPAATKKKR